MTNDQWYKFGLIAVLSSCLLLISPSGLLSKSPSLPSLKPHPLPILLQKWQDTGSLGDYFGKISPSPLGYLVWSKFPVKVYLDKPSDSISNSASDVRFLEWIVAVRNAIAEWGNYLSLVEIEQKDLADIIILRSQVDREIKLNPTTGLYDIPRAITAQTNYEFYLTSEKPPIISHRMIVQISPDLGQSATITAARHELGHAMGIWGHSDLATDALYFSQVPDPPPISPRDINTLKKIYQQPTKLGWKVNN